MTSSKRLLIVADGETPPGGWEYTQPETGMVIRAVTARGLKNNLEIHRRANGIPLEPGWWEDLQEEVLCTNERFSRFCRHVKVKTPVPDPTLHARDLRNFLRAMKEWFRAGRALVAHEEAVRRAEICHQCPLRADQPDKGCLGCSGVYARIKRLLPKDSKPLPDEDKLVACRVCKCSLPVKIRLPEDVLRASHDPKHIFPENCWLPKIVEQKGPDQ